MRAQAVHAHALVHDHTSGSLPAQTNPEYTHASKQAWSAQQAGSKCRHGEWEEECTCTH